MWYLNYTSTEPFTLWTDDNVTISPSTAHTIRKRKTHPLYLVCFKTEFGSLRCVFKWNAALPAGVSGTLSMPVSSSYLSFSFFSWPGSLGASAPRDTFQLGLPGPREGAHFFLPILFFLWVCKKHTLPGTEWGAPSPTVSDSLQTVLTKRPGCALTQLLKAVLHSPRAENNLILGFTRKLNIWSR